MFMALRYDHPILGSLFLRIYQHLNNFIDNPNDVGNQIKQNRTNERFLFHMLHWLSFYSWRGCHGHAQIL